MSEAMDWVPTLTAVATRCGSMHKLVTPGRCRRAQGKDRSAGRTGRSAGGDRRQVSGVAARSLQQGAQPAPEDDP